MSGEIHGGLIERECEEQREETQKCSFERAKAGGPGCGIPFHPEIAGPEAGQVGQIDPKEQHDR